MIRKLVWCLFILLVFSENHCSPTERDLYAFSTIANEEQVTTQAEDTETAETNTYSGPYSDDDVENSQEDPPGPPDHVIPYSEHENPDEVPTKPKYVAPGHWAKPDPKKNIPLDFVPTKSLAQVRGTHSVKVLPQSEAIASATSDEERENAPRLREVVSKKKTNTIYTEEGYEDSAYDHAGHIRDADFHEGYARKLHDQRRSKARSGKRRKKKSKKKNSNYKKPNVNPEEFEEFSDDYSDEHSAPSDKYEAEGSSGGKRSDNVNKIYKDMWKRPDVNPKIVTENEIEKLELDLKKEAEEAEKGSENYGSGTERNVPQNYENGGTNSDDSRYSSRTLGDGERRPSSGTKDRYYTENYEATTIQFETPNPGDSERLEGSTSGYENPTTNRYYLPDGSAVQENYEATTFNYDNPTNPQPIVNDAPTTVNYGQLFWQYFRDKPNENTSPISYLQEQTTIQEPSLLRETTTLRPFADQTPPVALATINGHGPYLLVSENGEVTQNPNGLGGEGLTYRSTIQNGHQPIDPRTIFNQEYENFINSQVINSRSGQSFPSFINSNGHPNSEFGNWGFGNGEISVISTDSPTTRFYDNIAFASTPTYSVISPPLSDYETSKATSQQESTYQKNPFFNFNSAEGESGNHENFDSLYKSWPNGNQDSTQRDKEQSASKAENYSNASANRLKSKSNGKKENSFFGYTPNMEYSKVLNFLESQQKSRYGGQKSESVDAEDFTIMKPPPLRESVFSDFTPNSYPNVAGYSSVTQESETAQKANGKKVDANKNSTKYNGLSHKGTHFKSQTFSGNNAPALSNRKRLFPPSKLLPPDPNSQVLNYADHDFSNQRKSYNPNHGTRVSNYSPDSEQLARYFNSRKRTSRRTRSLEKDTWSEEKVANNTIAKEMNARFNFTFKDQGSKKRAKGNLIPDEHSSVSGRSLPTTRDVLFDENHDHRSSRSKRSHQDFLDASHKIAGDVIDGEINSRFKTKDDEGADEDYDEDDEEGDEAEREKQVEVDIPDLDYLDEIQDVNEIRDIPTTTVASIDPQKYPFYGNTKVPNSSPLKYIINPKDVPRKTFGGMEFYDSRDKYVRCEELDPNLDEIVPDDEEPEPNKGPKEDLPRLRGLGDKLDCFKAKYFGRNPFDNPLFFEKQINQPTPPSELDPVKFASRILELPEENRNYFVPAKSRKPETVPVRRMDSSNRRRNSKNQAESTTVKPLSEPRNTRRNNRDQVKESTLAKPETSTRRTRKRRPTNRPQTTTTEPSDINSVTPYQKEVYEDVMGTIKNLASLYEMFGVQTASPLTEATIKSPHAGHIGASSIRNVKTLNRSPTLNGKREKDLHSSATTKSPFHEEIEGLMPPPEMSMKPKFLPYRTNKVSYITRARTESPLRNSDKKVIGYFRTVMVHKRSLDNSSGPPIGPESDAGEHSVKKRSADDSAFAKTRPKSKSDDHGTSSATTGRPNRGRRRKTNLSTTTTTEATAARTDSGIETENGTRRPHYFVRGSSRNSKDDQSSSRHGLFTTSERPSTVTDARRNEPRYSEIMRRRGQTTTTTTPSPEKPTSTSTLETESKEIYESENSVPRKNKISAADVEPTATASEFEPEEVEEDDEQNENYEEEEEEAEDDEEEKSTVKPEKIIRNYDVHEDVQEDTTPSVVGFPKPTRTSEFVDVESYLLTDPPGYSEAFVGDPESTVSQSNAAESGDKNDNYQNQESKEDEVEEEEDEEHREAPQSSSYRGEESSDEDASVSPEVSESYKDSTNDNSDESEDEGKHSEQTNDDDKTFFRFDSRPNSPFESFEDDKYTELGPRVNKPAFYHPPFEAPKNERFYNFDDSEEDKEDKTGESSESEKYVFPWVHDEEDEKLEAEEAAAYGEQTTEKYEYPWDKRERLAQERAQRRRDRERLKQLRAPLFQDDDDDYEGEDDRHGSSSETNKKVTYPWDIYDVPSKEYKMNFKKDDEFDNDKTSSEHRPVAKFSSKYSSSKFALPFPGSEPIVTAQPKEIRKSVLKYLESADAEASVEPTVAYETDASTTRKPEYLRPASEPVRKMESGSKSNKRVTSSRIIPETITTAPRTRSRSRGTTVRARTTLRPVVRTTTENVVVAQTTAAPIMQTTRRPTRSRGRSKDTRTQSSYVAVESRVASNTAVSTPRSTIISTTAKPADSSTKSPERYGVRKRGKSKVGKSENPSKQNVEKDVGGKSKQATTTSRRKTRPTSATRTTKTTNKKYAKPRKHPRVDTKNSLKETKYDEYRIPPTTSVNGGNRMIEDPNPTSRTVEHRSRVSKEEIITKTSYPDPDAVYKGYKDKSTVKKGSSPNGNAGNVSLTNRKLEKTYSETSDRARNSFGTAINSKNESPMKNESVESLSITMKETPEHVYEKKEILDKDGHKGMYLSIIPKNYTVAPSALEDELHLKKASEIDELEKEEELKFFEFDDTNVQNAESNSASESTLPKDISVLDHILRKIPPPSNHLKEREDTTEEYVKSSEENSSQNPETTDGYIETKGSIKDKGIHQSEEKSSAVKIEKDPSRRLYYYLDDKK